MFLDSVAQMFEVVVFTAAQSIYAGELLDILDPDRKIISKRMYRESCVFSDGTYTKDLTILGVDLAKGKVTGRGTDLMRARISKRDEGNEARWTARSNVCANLNIEMEVRYMRGSGSEVERTI
ncbi:hypothetical protein BHM03_00000213 [Ensete ventricosum]|nr:hypothetical protein BHM03_00000213 [Ensete ventricosum]